MATTPSETPVIAISSAFLYRRSLPTNLMLAKAAGFENIELFLSNNVISMPYEEISSDVENSGLRVVSIHLPIPFSYNEEWPDLERSIKKGLDWADRLGAVWIVSHPLVVMADADTELKDAVRKRYLRILDLAAKHSGCEKILIENMPNLGGNRPIKNLFEYPDEFRSVVERSGFGMVFDTTHWGSFDPDVTRGYNAFKPLIRNIHLSDLLSGTEHIVPGDGDLDLDILLHELAETGYSRQLTLELDFTTRGRNAGRDDETVIADLVRTREWMASAFSGRRK